MIAIYKLFHYIGHGGGATSVTHLPINIPIAKHLLSKQSCNVMISTDSFIM